MSWALLASRLPEPALQQNEGEARLSTEGDFFRPKRD